MDDPRKEKAMEKTAELFEFLADNDYTKTQVSIASMTVLSVMSEDSPNLTMKKSGKEITYTFTLHEHAVH